MSGKYVVRKADGTLLEPGTFFVLRSGDKFAYAAMWQYSNVLQLALEMSTDLTEEERQRIRELQALVDSLAERWQASAGKVPD